MVNGESNDLSIGLSRLPEQELFQREVNDLDIVLRFLYGAGGAILFFGMIIAVLIGIGWLFELRRRRLEDRSGFGAFIDGGAKMSHPSLLSGFAGHPPQAGVIVKVVEMGRLKVESGEIYVFDPAFFDSPELQPFDELISPGELRVEAVIVERDGDQRVAAVRVIAEDCQVDHIEPAWTARDRIECRKLRTLPGVGVDSATLGLFTAESLAGIRAAGQDIGSYSPGSEDASINPYLTGKPEDLFGEFSFANGSNCFTFLSGIGDGLYPCFFAKTADGAITALLIDCCFFDEPERLGFSRPSD